MKSQILNPKSHANSKLQIPNESGLPYFGGWDLGFGVCGFAL